MNVPFVDLKSQYENIKSEIDKAIKEILDTTSFIMGKPVEEFEKKFASFCTAKECIGTSSGTSALELALQSANIKQGDEILTVTNTFIATTEAISSVGAKVVFVDIDKDTQLMDSTKLEQAITPKTKAIVPVHLFGQPCDMTSILKIARKHNLIVIEDCAQAHGATYHGKKIPISDIGCFSFYPGKNLGAYGDAGAIVTNNQKISEKARLIVNHGRKKGDKYIHTIPGNNYRLDALQAKILGVKLKHLNEWVQKRREIAKKYDELLSEIPFVEPVKINEDTESAYHLYVITAKHRDELQKFLKEKKISTGIHYPIPLHLQPAYKELNYKEGDFPISENAAKEILSLPIFPELKDEQIEYVVLKIKEFYEK